MIDDPISDHVRGDYRSLNLVNLCNTRVAPDLLISLAVIRSVGDCAPLASLLSFARCRE